MDKFLTQSCTAEQCGVLMQNSMRYARVGNAHIRIRPPTSDVAVHPLGQVQYLATIEILDEASSPWGSADEVAVQAVTALFGSVLSGSGG